MIPVVTPPEAADVGCDELTRLGVRPDSLDLILLIAPPGVGDEALVVE
jgi:hypothetical protein